MSYVIQLANTQEDGKANAEILSQNYLAYGDELAGYKYQVSYNDYWFIFVLHVITAFFGSFFGFALYVIVADSYTRLNT